MYLAVLFPEPEWKSWLWFSQKKKKSPQNCGGGWGKDQAVGEEDTGRQELMTGYVSPRSLLLLLLLYREDVRGAGRIHGIRMLFLPGVNTLPEAPQEAQ